MGLASAAASSAVTARKLIESPALGFGCRRGGGGRGGLAGSGGRGRRAAAAGAAARRLEAGGRLAVEGDVEVVLVAAVGEEARTRRSPTACRPRSGAGRPVISAISVASSRAAGLPELTISPSTRAMSMPRPTKWLETEPPEVNCAWPVLITESSILCFSVSLPSRAIMRGSTAPPRMSFCASASSTRFLFLSSAVAASPPPPLPAGGLDGRGAAPAAAAASGGTTAAGGRGGGASARVVVRAVVVLGGLAGAGADLLDLVRRDARVGQVVGVGEVLRLLL